MRPLLIVIPLTAIVLQACTGASDLRAELTPFTDITECFQRTGKEQERCYEEFVLRLATQEQTTGEMLAGLVAAREEDERIENNCHPIVHAIGRWTYKQFGNIGDAFEACDMTCHSGCYHGIMERQFFTDEQLAAGMYHLTFDIMEDVIPGMCDRDKFSDTTQSLIFQCLHGGGHALLFSLEYDLEATLRACDLLTTGYDKSSCYGGVFMENVTAIDKSQRDIDPHDPLYPCNKIDEKYRSSCYLMQTSIMLEQGLSEEEIGKTCLTAGTFARQCFISFGRDYSNHVRTGNMEKALVACEQHSHDYTESCISGLVYALIDNTWDASFAYQYCNALHSEENKETCFRVSNSYLDWSYEMSSDAIRRSCKKLAGRGKNICLSIVPETS